MLCIFLSVHSSWGVRGLRTRMRIGGSRVLWEAVCCHGSPPRLLPAPLGALPVPGTLCAVVPSVLEVERKGPALRDWRCPSACFPAGQEEVPVHSTLFEENWGSGHASPVCSLRCGKLICGDETTATASLGSCPHLHPALGALAPGWPRGQLAGPLLFSAALPVKAQMISPCFPALV